MNYRQAGGSSPEEVIAERVILPMSQGVFPGPLCLTVHMTVFSVILLTLKGPFLYNVVCLSLNLVHNMNTLATHSNISCYYIDIDTSMASAPTR